jgi:biotin carboxyl carrier protein
MVVDGMATALPFHRAIVRDEAFTTEPFRVHTRWIETEWAGGVEPFTGAADAAAPEERTTVVVEVVGSGSRSAFPPASARRGAAAPAGPTARRSTGRKAGGAPAASGDSLVSPMQGTIVKLVVGEGDEVAEGDPVVVIEAMKMEQPLAAHKGRRRHRAVGDGRRGDHRGRGDLRDQIASSRTACRPASAPIASNWRCALRRHGYHHDGGAVGHDLHPHAGDVAVVEAHAEDRVGSPAACGDHHLLDRPGPRLHEHVGHVTPARRCWANGRRRHTGCGWTR